MSLILSLALFSACFILLCISFKFGDSKKSLNFLVAGIISGIASVVVLITGSYISIFAEKTVSDESQKNYLLSKQTLESYTDENLLEYAVLESENGNYKFKYIKEDKEIELEISKNNININIDDNVEAPFLVIYKKTQVPKNDILHFLVWPNATFETTYEIYISANEIITFK